MSICAGSDGAGSLRGRRHRARVPRGASPYDDLLAAEGGPAGGAAVAAGGGGRARRARDAGGRRRPTGAGGRGSRWAGAGRASAGRGARVVVPGAPARPARRDAGSGALRASLGLLSHYFVIGPFGEGRASLNTPFPPEQEPAPPVAGRALSGQDTRGRLARGRRGVRDGVLVPGRPAPSRRPGRRLRRDVRAQRPRPAGRAAPRLARADQGLGQRRARSSRATSFAPRRWIRMRSASGSGAAGTGS